MLKFALIATTSSRVHALTGGIRLRTMPTSTAIYSTTTSSSSSSSSITPPPAKNLLVRDFVDEIITVSEKEILQATKLVWERLKIVIEPSAGVGVAVANSLEFNTKYKKSHGINNVGIILCGGNVDIIKMASMMEDFGL